MYENIERHSEKIAVVNSFVTCFTMSYDEGYVFDGEAHDFWEFHYVVKGKIGVSADGEVYELEKGQLIIYEPMCFHRWWNVTSGSVTIAVVSFDAKFSFNLKNSVYNLSGEESTLLAELTKNVSRGYRNCNGNYFLSVVPGCEGEAQIARNLLENFVIKLNRKETLITGKNTGISAGNYMRIVEILAGNTGKRLTVPEIAGLSGMSISNLNKTFVKYAGIGVLKYFNSLKMREAIRMLREGYTVTETAEALGFMEVSYFSYAFKREFGKSPVSFRNQ